MKPADAQLIEQIQQATRGGSRLLCTLARRGKAIERDEPQRAEFLLAAVRSHPFYKGGRLAFDMLEIEDLMLDSSVTYSINTFEFTQVLSAGVHNLVEVLRSIGSGPQGSQVPAETSGGQTDLLGRAKDTHVPGAATVLPRVSFGRTHAAVAGAHQFLASDEDLEGVQREPELTSSDYLYDFVVLGFLDMLGGMRMEL